MRLPKNIRKTLEEASIGNMANTLALLYPRQVVDAATPEMLAGAEAEIERCRTDEERKRARGKDV